MSVRFFIPIKPVPKGRPRFSTAGPYVRTYTPGKTRAFERDCALYANLAMQGRPPLDPPVAVKLVFYLEPPKSWSVKNKQRAIDGEILPTKRPDLDNYAKSVMDGIAGKVLADDSHATDMTLLKRYGHDACTLVIAATIDGKAPAP